MKTANAWNHWKQNALLIVKYATVYPFKLPDSCLVCVYCFERCDSSALFRQHMEVEHEGMAVPRLIFAHCHESYLKADCSDIKCRICSQQCETLEEISLHLHGVHKKGIDLELPIGIQPFKPDRLECTICGNKSYNLRQLNRHTQSHFLRFTCETCGKAFATKSALTVHFKSVHEITKPYCRKCKTFFDTPSEKAKHMVTSSKCWTYICRSCGERFSTWEIKQVHLEKVHGELQNTVCPQCGMEFGTRKMLKNHFRLQHTDDNFICTVCGHKFTSKKAIEEHRVIHTKERNFHCTSCNKSFARKKNLIQHMWIHSEYKRFECKMCDKKFNQRVSWKSHMKTNHPALYMETAGDYKMNQSLVN